MRYTRLYCHLNVLPSILLIVVLLIFCARSKAQFLSSTFAASPGKTDSTFLFTRMLYDGFFNRYELFYYDDFYSSFFDRNQTRKTESIRRFKNGILASVAHFDKGFIKKSYSILEKGSNDTVFYSRFNYSNSDLTISVDENRHVEKSGRNVNNYFRDNTTIYTFSSSHQLLRLERKYENDTIIGRYTYNSMNFIDTIQTSKWKLKSLQYSQTQNSFIKNDITYLLDSLTRKQKRILSKFKVYKNSLDIVTNNDSFLRVVMVNHEFNTAYIKYIARRGSFCYFIMYDLPFFDSRYDKDIQQLASRWEKYKTDYPDSRRNTIMAFKFYDNEGSYLTMDEISGSGVHALDVSDNFPIKKLHFQKSSRSLKIFNHYCRLTTTEYFDNESIVKFYK